jgi:hypothetical protein
MVAAFPDKRKRPPSSARTCGVPERQDEEAHPPVIAGVRVARHRSVAVLDLALLTGGLGDHHVGLGRCPATQLPDEPWDTRCRSSRTAERTTLCSWILLRVTAEKEDINP